MFEQRFPGGQRGERHGSRLRPVQAFGLVRGNARIHQLVSAVAAGAGDVAGIPHFIAHLEPADVAAHFLDDPGRVPAQNTWMLQAVLLQAGVDFRIHRVDGYRFDRHQQVIFARRRLLRGDLDERGWMLWIYGNGFNRHECAPYE